MINYDPHNPDLVIPPEPIEDHYVRCVQCGNPIYYWDGGQDYCVNIDGEHVCEDCIKEYIKDCYFEKLEVETNA